MAPMLAEPFHRPGWVYEEKYDGWRMIGQDDQGMSAGKSGQRRHQSIDIALQRIPPTPR